MTSQVYVSSFHCLLIIASSAHTIERGALEASIGLSDNHHINCPCHVWSYLEQSAACRQGIDLQVRLHFTLLRSLCHLSAECYVQASLSAPAGFSHEPARQIQC